MAEREQLICRTELEEAGLGPSYARNRKELGFLGQDMVDSRGKL